MVVLAYALERGAGRRMTSLIVDPDRASMGFGLANISASASGGALSAALPKRMVDP